MTAQRRVSQRRPRRRPRHPHRRALCGILMGACLSAPLSAQEDHGPDGAAPASSPPETSTPLPSPQPSPQPSPPQPPTSATANVGGDLDLAEQCLASLRRHERQLKRCEADLEQVRAELEEHGLRPSDEFAERIDRLLAEQERLRQENTRLEQALAAAQSSASAYDGGLAAKDAERLKASHRRQLAALAAALLAPSECDRIDTEVDEGGRIRITGVTPSRQSLAMLRERHRALADRIDTRFEVRIEPGGACNQRIGAQWRMLQREDGSMGEILYRNDLTALRDALPTREQCTAVEALARRRDELAAAFADGLDPQIWCVEEAGGEIGVCRRSGSNGQWRFIAGRAGKSAYALLRATTESDAADTAVEGDAEPNPGE